MRGDCARPSRLIVFDWALRITRIARAERCKVELGVTACVMQHGFQMSSPALFEGYGWGWGFDVACIVLIGVVIALALFLRARVRNQRTAHIQSRNVAHSNRPAMASHHDV